MQAIFARCRRGTIFRAQHRKGRKALFYQTVKTKTMKIEMVVFDMAGTTVNDEGNVTAAFAGAMKGSGYEVPDHFINPMMGYKKPLAIKMMLEQFEQRPELITPELIEVIHSRFVENMLTFYRSSPNLYALPNVEAVFIELKDAGIRVALNTGFSRDIAELIIERLGWWKNGLIDDFIASDDVEKGRPSPMMITELMKRAGIDSAKAVVKVGDTEVDINEGKNCGCAASVAVTTGSFTPEQLRLHHPDAIITNMIDLLPIIDQLNKSAEAAAEA